MGLYFYNADTVGKSDVTITGSYSVAISTPNGISFTIANEPEVGGLVITGLTAVRNLIMEFVSTSTIAPVACETLALEDCSDLSTLNLAGCELTRIIEVTGSSVLTHVTVPAAGLNALNISLSNGTLNATAVDGVLNAVVLAWATYGTTENGSIDLAGGGNAAPTAASLAARTALAAAGWEINTN